MAANFNDDQGRWDDGGDLQTNLEANLEAIRSMMQRSKAMRQKIIDLHQSIFLDLTSGKITQFGFEIEYHQLEVMNKTINEHMRELQAQRTQVLHRLLALEKSS